MHGQQSAAAAAAAARSAWNRAPDIASSSLRRISLSSSSTTSSTSRTEEAAELDEETAAFKRDLTQVRRRIASLMEQALIVYYDARDSWIKGQANGLIQHLAGRLQLVSFNSSTRNGSPQDKAAAIDEALLRGAPLEEVKSLVQDFQKVLERRRKLKYWSFDNELGTIEQQLDSFHAILGRRASSTIASAAVKPKEREVASLFLTQKTVKGEERIAMATTSAENSQLVVEDEERSETLVGEDKVSRATSPFEKVYNTGYEDSLEPEMDDAADDDLDDVVDVAIVGAGLGGLCAGAILNTVYGKKVGIYESHYLAGGCAHAFDRIAPSNKQKFTFDSGPTILLGCSSPPFNGLQQVLKAVGQHVEWIPYDGWGMIENPGKEKELRWRCELGPTAFLKGPLRQFGGDVAVNEFKALQRATKGLTAGAKIPAMAMRGGNTALFPLLRFFPTLIDLIKEGETLTGTFAPFMDGPIFTVTSPWLRDWLDALAFSLSGLPASRTAAAAMGFILNDMHRTGASLDYPKGGMGEIVQALVRGVEHGTNGSKVHLKQHVESIDCNPNGRSITGITLRKGGKKIQAREGVICNAPVWTLRDLIKDERVLQKLNNDLPLSKRVKPPTSWTVTESGSSVGLTRQESKKGKGGLLENCDTAEMTGSFLHLHLAIDAKGLNLDGMEAHYTVMDRSLSGNGSVVNGVKDGPCGESNMIAVSNPCVIDRTLAPDGYMVVHAYGAGNEPYELWESLDRNSPEYTKLKEERAECLWRAVESVIPDVRERTVLHLIGSPLTHERFLRRPRGTYGSSTEDYLKDGSTCYKTLVLASDGVFPGECAKNDRFARRSLVHAFVDFFVSHWSRSMHLPGIGVPSVAIAGASAANSFVNVFDQWRTLDNLKKNGKLNVS